MGRGMRVHNGELGTTTTIGSMEWELVQNVDDASDFGVARATIVGRIDGVARYMVRSQARKAGADRLKTQHELIRMDFDGPRGLLHFLGSWKTAKDAVSVAHLDAAAEGHLPEGEELPLSRDMSPSVTPS